MLPAVMGDPGRMKALVCRQLGNPLSKDDRKPLQLTSNYPKQPTVLPAGCVSSETPLKSRCDRGNHASSLLSGSLPDIAYFLT